MTTGYLFSSLVSLPHSFSRQDFITVYVIKSMEKEKEDRTESVTHGISREGGGGGNERIKEFHPLLLQRRKETRTKPFP